MNGKKKKIIGAAAGAAAAAAAVGVAAATMKGRKTHVFHVQPDGGGWIVTQEGKNKVSSRHETKREAVGMARNLAGIRPPSRLIIHRSDDSVQKEHNYQVER